MKNNNDQLVTTQVCFVEKGGYQFFYYTHNTLAVTFAETCTLYTFRTIIFIISPRLLSLHGSHLHVEHLTNESHFSNVITRCLIDTESNITLTAIFNLFLSKWNLTENEDAKNINIDSHLFPVLSAPFNALLLRMKCFPPKGSDLKEI